ncbi:MAG: isoaspartyl peptidase/L-asparaginase family protein [Flavobacteriales bacterium]
MNKLISIAIHGGAGTITREHMSAEKEAAYKQALDASLGEGYKVLASGGSALDSVEKAVRCLEDNPLFNAGRGSVFTYDGAHEMDASIMCGDTLAAGAIAGVKNIKNPVSLARAVMEKSEHVLLAGRGAELFAKEMLLDFQPDEYFYTDLRWQQWKDAQQTGVVQLDHTEGKKFGTVGAVALDAQGNIAAATSTGGMTNKRWGRAGDSPIIGAGTYADNNTCAVSCTGHGEFFIRAVVAYDVSCLMAYKGLSLQQACDTVVKDKLVKLGGEGGLIAVDALGNICLSFNSEGMYRAWRNADGKAGVAIYS